MMTTIPYVAIALTSFDYIDAHANGFHVNKGNAYTGVLDEEGNFNFVIYLHEEGKEEKYRMEVCVGHKTKRFSFHPVANPTTHADATKE
jgi:hypothetical protein